MTCQAELPAKSNGEPKDPKIPWRARGGGNITTREAQIKRGEGTLIARTSDVFACDFP